MFSADASEPDPLDVLAGVGAPAMGENELRQGVLLQTIGVIRRRRRLKRFSLVGALLGCYLAGLGTGRVWGPDLQSPAVSVADTSSKSDRSEDRALPAVVADRGNDTDAAVEESPFEVLRRISDRYLYEKRDLRLAIRYYGRALDSASAEERAISPEEDSWLLMALKQSRIEENPNEHDDG